MTCSLFARAICCLLILHASAAESRQPNFVVILADDLGYGDLACYGAADIPTPAIDRMAAEGVRLNDFYVSPVCSPTRAALMTGCHPTRVGIGGVLFPRNNTGLNPDEITLPEILQTNGYATALIGKWHLGNQDIFQPLNHGFDYWYGTPSSNSQSYDPNIKQYAADCVFREGYTREGIVNREAAACPLVRNNLVIEVPADQTRFTQRYTKEAIAFIEQNRDRPFFLYLAHNMPHIPLHTSPDFVGRSKRGPYGDTIVELDWSTGEILKALKRLQIDDNTLVIFTSDNGPNTSKGGSAGQLAGGKGSTLEGGVRVPFVARWPEKIPPATVCAEPATVMDLLPTLASLAGGSSPADRTIDGQNIWPLLSGKTQARSPHAAVFYLRGRGVQAIREGQWKYRMAADKSARSKQPQGADRTARRTRETLVNLQVDPGEQHNIIDQHPGTAARRKRQLEEFQRQLRESARPAGVAESDDDD